MSTKKPLMIKVNEKDNVAVVVSSGGINAGTRIDNSLVALENIPQSHKIALFDIKKGDKILRYGEVIGYAREDIPKGSWVHEEKVALPVAPSLDELPVATNIPEPLEKLEGYTFMGYRNSDGSVGTKNMLAIMTCVQCVEGVLNIAVERIKKELLPLYPNVDGIMPINHIYGCGVAINAPEAKVPIRTLQNIARHPNFGGEIVTVALGCEKLQPDMLYGGTDPKHLVMLQDETGFENMVQSIMKEARECLEILNRRKREECPVSELVVGLQCGGSDALSGVTANPAVGYAADLLVRAGATVMFSEVSEIRDGIHLLTPRTINSEVGQKLKDEIAWYDRYLKAGHVDRDANPSPGNKKGGLTNIVEKSLGSIVKSGTSPIVDVISAGERATKKGLIFAATPASDFVCGTLQLASGITVQVFTTGRGTPYGLAMVPVIKVSTNTELKKKWPDLIDVDAGVIATGETTIEETGWEIFKLILDVASGVKKVWADQWGVINALSLFNPAPIT